MESKSESKFSESKSEEKSSTPKEIVHITSIDINPNRCLITDPLTLAVDFTLDEAVNEGVWEIKFLVDSVSKRYIVILGAVELRNYRVGKNSFTFKTDKIDVSKIPPGNLTNCGLLIASLSSKDEEIMDLKLFCQVLKNDKGEILRCIYSPLDDE